MNAANKIFQNDGILFLDGAMGTQLQARGLRPGEVPELWNLARPDDIRSVHESYLAAGANVVYANTFGATGGGSPRSTSAPPGGS